MKFLNLFVAFGLLMPVGFVNAQQVGSGTALPLNNRADSVAYAFGAAVARDLKGSGLEEINADILAQAVADIFSGKEARFDEDVERELVMDAITTAREKLTSRMKNESDAFMERNGSRAGVVTTASGLQYEVLREGSGERPALADTVTVHYKGQLSDGREFDSSYDRGEPATFPLERVIAGWQEGLQLVPVGGHYRIYVPYDLGYGERGAGQDIPPYSALVFEVELISVNRSVTADITQ